MISYSEKPRRIVVLTASAIAMSFLTLAAPVSVRNAAADKPGQDVTATAEWFAAMDAGQIDVKIIPQDATRATVLVKNLTDKPLDVKLPEAFASVPVLAQGMMGGGMGGGGMGGGGMGGGGMGGGGGQAGGGGMGGGGMGGGGMGGGGMGGGGGGFMRLAPEKMRKVAVDTVCLEHGKQDPNPRMAYKMVPLEQFTQDASVRVLCESLGYRQVTQNAAQAAAWHLMDGLTWQELAAKNRVESKYTGNERWFSHIELRTAQAIVSEAARIAKLRTSTSTSTEQSAAEYDPASFEG